MISLELELLQELGVSDGYFMTSDRETAGYGILPSYQEHSGPPEDTAHILILFLQFFSSNSFFYYL